MSYRLYVRPVPPFADLVTDPQAQLYGWVLLDASGDAQARGSADSRLHIEQTLARNALEQVRLIGLFPGDEALFCSADIPARQERYIHQALPFAVEEQLAQDIESMHLALGSRGDAGFRVAAIDHQRMALWKTLFEDWEHARLEAVYADASLLPVNEQDWAICLDGSTALLASRRGEWLRMQVNNLAIFADTLAMPSEEEVVAEVRVAVFGTEGDLAQHQPLLDQLSGSSRLAVDRQALQMTPLELLAHAHHHHYCQPINLCQGSYSVSREGSGAWRAWRPAVAVAGLWFVLQLGVEIGLGVYHQNRAEQLNAEAMSIYREVFPGDTRTHAGNVRNVLLGQLRVAAQDGPQADFLALMKQTAQEYSQLNGSQTVQFNSINYSQARGELVVDLRADDFSKLSALRSALTQQGLEANIGSVVNEPAGARGRLTISGG
ncbi:MAG: type II secretion system protein GspL [Marinobacter sp.]|uniref:type II secretion system protein GspL n=1 Tax=Marinobacter sp. TaxID=50741 RepID=UPI00299D7119|nr:type II secretion system protein GspL [Marinobacter sp.]MDX1634561.1 type II secretion system protein GspL [Marinobacter sp.]